MERAELTLSTPRRDTGELAVKLFFFLTATHGAGEWLVRFARTELLTSEEELRSVFEAETPIFRRVRKIAISDY